MIPVIDTLSAIGNYPIATAHDIAHNGERLDNLLATKSDKTTTEAALNGKVDKVTGKMLSDNNYSDADMVKLGGIENGANKTIVDTVLSTTSTNPISNAAITHEINEHIKPDVEKFNSWFTLKTGV